MVCSSGIAPISCYILPQTSLLQTKDMGGSQVGHHAMVPTVPRRSNDAYQSQRKALSVGYQDFRVAKMRLWEGQQIHLKDWQAAHGCVTTGGLRGVWRPY